MNIKQVNIMLLNTIDRAISHKTSKLVGYVFIVYCFVNVYFTNSHFFVFCIQLLVAGLLVILFVCFVLPIIYIIYTIIKFVFTFCCDFIKYKLGYDHIKNDP